MASLGKESLRLLSNKARHERGKEDIRAAAADRQEDAPAEEDNDSETESSDGEDEELDTEHANKVLDEDWDTSTWTPPEIEAACETLINVRMGLGGARSILTHCLHFAGMRRVRQHQENGAGKADVTAPPFAP